jgi:hypothetical protein
MNALYTYNHWRRADRIKVFAPRSVADVKLGKQDQRLQYSTDCASCGSGCSGGGCSGAGCGSSCGSSCR